MGPGRACQILHYIMHILAGFRSLRGQVAHLQNFLKKNQHFCCPHLRNFLAVSDLTPFSHHSQLWRITSDATIHFFRYTEVFCLFCTIFSVLISGSRNLPNVGVLGKDLKELKDRLAASFLTKEFHHEAKNATIVFCTIDSSATHLLTRQHVKTFRGFDVIVVDEASQVWQNPN